MSLISEALKTAQRERSERVGAAPAERHLVEGFFPLGAPVRDEAKSRRNYAMLIVVVAIVGIGGAAVLRMRKPSSVPLKPIALPALPNQAPVAAPPAPAPVLAIGPAAAPAGIATSDVGRTVAEAPTRGASPATAVAAPDPRDASRVVTAPPTAGGVRADVAGQAKPQPDTSSAIAGRGAVAPAPSAVLTRQSAPPAEVRVTVEGGTRRPTDLLAVEALTAQQQGNFDRAQELYERVIAGAPTADVFNNYGVLLLQRGDTAAAILMYRRAVKLDPTKIEAWANLGEALDQRGIHAEATSAFQQVLKLDPTNVRARVQLAAQYSTLGSPGDARRILEELTRSVPRDPAGHYALAGFLVTQRDIAGAVREFDQFLQLAPGVYDQRTLDTVKAYVASIRPRP
jgi:Tfp pilus assembly protein PilF